MLALALLLGSLASADGGGAEADEALPEALELLYDGSTEAALARLEVLRGAHPDDALYPYLEALAFAWRVEQRPQSRAQDAELLERADRALAAAERRLRLEPNDAQALFARGAAHGVKSRLHMFRRRRRDATRAAVRMRADLLRVVELDPSHEDARFGLALYDYYADVLPKLLKLLRFLSGAPGGDRERGLRGLERAAAHTRWHRAEARAQLFEIYAFYEDDPDAALPWIEGLWNDYPGSPLWGLRLAEHQRERLGLLGEALETAREIARRSDAGEANFAPIVGRMARLAMGRTLLLDYRLEAAIEALRGALGPTATAAADEVAAAASLALGQALELRGGRPDALRHYAAAARASDTLTSRAGREASKRPMAAAWVAAVSHLGRGRRLREAGAAAEAVAAFRQAHEIWPKDAEAQLRVAEAELESGCARSAVESVASIVDGRSIEPPWVGAEAALLLARCREREDRAAADRLYLEVSEHPFGREDWRRAALAARARLGAGEKPAPRD